MRKLLGALFRQVVQGSGPHDHSGLYGRLYEAREKLEFRGIVFIEKVDDKGYPSFEKRAWFNRTIPSHHKGEKGRKDFVLMTQEDLKNKQAALSVMHIKNLEIGKALEAFNRISANRTKHLRTLAA